MSIGLITLLLFGGLILTLVAGMPVAFGLGGVALVFTYLLWGPQAVYGLALTTFGQMLNLIIIPVPLFILMAYMLLYSNIAEDLFTMIHRWAGSLVGGLAMGTVVLCALMAAMTGISGAATVSMGIIALPAMLNRNYHKSIAVGSVAAGGALGILIPPSVIMIIYASFTGVSVGGLFAGGVLPGLLLAGLFILYIGIKTALQPELAPSPPLERVGWREKFAGLRAVILPILLIIGVMGSIFTGIATPTEASAIGAAGSFVCAIVYRKLTWRTLKDACSETLKLTSMIMLILVGATCFGNVYTAVGAPEFVNQLLGGLHLGWWGILILTQLFFFILGCFMDPTAIVMICCPVFTPIVAAMGFNPLWFGILFVMNMQMAYITPPFGYNLFYLKGVVPSHISIGDIYRSIIPFVALQALGLAIVAVFPQIALWLPSLMIK